MRTKNMIFGVAAPSKVCDDMNCPFHGTLKVRGKTFTGTVVSDRMQKSVLVKWEGQRFVSKYDRYKKTRTKIPAHLPPCISVKEGAVVKIVECRPLSKTKNFVVLGIVGEESVKSKVKKVALEEAAKPKKESKEENKKEHKVEDRTVKAHAKPAKPHRKDAEDGSDDQVD